jgi:cytochrome c-type biogenesis protein
MLATLGLAFLAGALSILSPCVVPLLPIVLGTAASHSKYGPVALGLGVVISFVTVGLFVALVGFSIGLDGSFFRRIAAIMLLAIGLLLILPRLQNRFSLLASPMSAWAQNKLGGVSSLGQFGVGLLLGIVWSPCVGPTLGAASLLAAQGKDVVQVALTMTAFAIGVGVPLVGIGLLSRSVLQKSRSNLMVASSRLKAVLGVALVALGGLILAGVDKQFEAALVTASPLWLTNLTTQF